MSQNNYQRLSNLSAKPDVRFGLRWAGGDALEIPSNKSTPLTVPPGAWWVWPFGMNLFSAVGGAKGPQLAWATAQLLTEVNTSASSSVIFLVETAGVVPEVALSLGTTATLAAHGGDATVEGDRIVLRALHPSHEAVATVKSGERTTSIVLLRTAEADRAWTAELAGSTRFLISDDAELLLGDGDLLRVRAQADLKQLSILICPSVASLSLSDGQVVPRADDGVFGSFSFSQPPLLLPRTLKTTLIKQAGPPRVIPLAPSQKPQEPTAEDWHAAAEYTVELGSLTADADGSIELRLAIDYAADAARVFLGDRLLTDNWLSGYYGSDGAMEVGLTYLAGELPSLREAGTTLRVLLLPLQQAALRSNIWLQPELWPDFNGNATVCRLDAVRPLALRFTKLTASAVV